MGIKSACYHVVTHQLILNGPLNFAHSIYKSNYVVRVHVKFSRSLLPVMVLTATARVINLSFQLTMGNDYWLKTGPSAPPGDLSQIDLTINCPRTLFNKVSLEQQSKNRHIILCSGKELYRISLFFCSTQYGTVLPADNTLIIHFRLLWRRGRTKTAWPRPPPREVTDRVLLIIPRPRRATCGRGHNPVTLVTHFCSRAPRPRSSRLVIAKAKHLWLIIWSPALEWYRN